MKSEDIIFEEDFDTWNDDIMAYEHFLGEEEYERTFKSNTKKPIRPKESDEQIW